MEGLQVARAKGRTGVRPPALSEDQKIEVLRKKTKAAPKRHRHFVQS
jgi:hypothetical protein